MVIEDASITREADLVRPCDVSGGVLEQPIDLFSPERRFLQHCLEYPFYLEPDHERPGGCRPALACLQRSHDFGATESLPQIVPNLPAKVDSCAFEAKVGGARHGVSPDGVDHPGGHAGSPSDDRPIKAVRKQ